MKDETRKLLFVILFMSCLFMVVMGIMMLYLLPQERLGTIFWIISAIISLAAFYFMIYRKESIEKRRVAIIISLAGIFMVLGVIYDLPKKTASNRLVDSVLIIVFGLFCILGLTGRRSFKGIVIDNSCVSAQKPEDLHTFIKVHPKSCVLKPDSIASGYSIYADGRLQKFDKISNQKIDVFLKKDDSRLEVEVLVKLTDDGLRLITIQNQRLS